MVSSRTEIRLRAARLALALAAGATGCACSPTLEDAFPGQRRTGAFPDLNAVAPPATEQITDEEAATAIAELNAARDQLQGQGGGAASEAERLRRLAETHAEDTIREIEQ